MRFLASILALCAIPAAGQTFTLGTSSDPCVGGQSLTIANSTATVRWGDFTCTFTVSPAQQLNPTLYTVQLEFLEPCAQAGACFGNPAAGVPGQVTKSGQRLENIYANDQPILANLDPFRVGATDTAPAVRAALIYSYDGTITVRVQTVIRSAVLSQVTIAPALLIGVGGITMSRAVCVGNGKSGPALLDYGYGGCINPAGCTVTNRWDCAGQELYRINATAYVAVPATPELLAVPMCPSTPGSACWQSAPIGQ